MMLFRDADDSDILSLTTAVHALGFNYCPTSAHRNICVAVGSHWTQLRVGIVMLILKWNLVLRFDLIILDLKLPSVKIQFGFTLEIQTTLYESTI